MLKALQKPSNPKQIFLDSVIALGDIGVAELTQGRLVGAKITLGLIYSLFLRIKKLQKSTNKKDRDLLKKLMIDYDYYNLLKSIKGVENVDIENSEKKYLALVTIVNQIDRVAKKSLEVRADNISVQSVRYLHNMFEECFYHKKNKELTNFFLTKIHKISQLALKSENKSVISLSYSWYTTLLTQYSFQNRRANLDINNLAKINKFFFDSIKTLISRENTVVFKELLSHIYLENSFIYTPKIKFSDIERLNSAISADKSTSITDKEKATLREERNKLSFNAQHLFSLDQIKMWISDFKHHVSKIKSLAVDSDVKKTIRKIEISTLNKSKQIFLKNRLRYIFFLTGAWATYTKNYRFLPMIWDFFNPDDADGTYVGDDVNFHSIHELMYFYTKVAIEKTSLDSFWDGRSDSTTYKRRYLLLLLARFVRENEYGKGVSLPDNSKTGFPKIEYLADINLKNFDNEMLDYLVGEINSLINELSVLHKSGLLKEVKITKVEEESIQKINNCLEELLLRMQKKIAVQIQVNNSNITFDEEQVKLFKTEFFKNYFRRFNLKVLISKLVKTNYKDINLEPNLELVGSKTLQSKKFFRQDHTFLKKLAESFARQFANYENEKIAGLICSSLREHSFKNLAECLENFGPITQNVIIMASSTFCAKLEDDSNFTPEYRMKTSEIKKLKSHGYYKYKQKKIRIFEINLDEYESYYAVFDIASIDCLTLYLPEETTIKNINSTFYISFTDLKDDEGKLNEIIKKSDWIAEKGNLNEQILFLQEKLQLEITTKFKLIPGKSIRGFFSKHEV